MYLCVYINIIRTQPEWTFSINRNMLLGLILKRTFSIKRNLARALYRSSCRRRWQHRTWCSTLKWIKVTAGNSTLLSMFDAPPSVLPVPRFCFFCFPLYIMQELCLIAIVYFSQLRIYPFSAHSISASISLVPLCFYLARSSWSWLPIFLSLSCSSAPSSRPRVFICVKIVVYVLMWAPFCQVK